MSVQTQYELVGPPSDAISALCFSPNSPRLLVSSWDKQVYLYDTSESGGRLLQTYDNRAPILAISFGETDDEAFTAGLDWDVRRLNLSTAEHRVLSSHSKGVKCLAYSQKHRILVSASWDASLHIHHPYNASIKPSTIALPSKALSISLSTTKLVVAMSSRALHIYDLAKLASDSAAAIPHSSELAVLDTEPFQRRESSLKFMTRAVACMPNDAGYASSSIEGRVAVEWFDPSPESQSRKYAFKCHRQQSPEGVDVVYPVNALAFHPVHGTFASGGGDGLVALWDGVAKRRIRLYQRYAASVAALSFSSDGRFLAVAISPGFEDGKEVIGGGTVKVYVRELGENEAKRKGAE